MRRFLKSAIDLALLPQRTAGRLPWDRLILLALGIACWLVAGFVDLRILFDALGGGIVGALGVAGGITLLPLTFGASPLYALFEWGDWMPLVFTCAGPGILALMAPQLNRRMRAGRR